MAPKQPNNSETAKAIPGTCTEPKQQATHASVKDAVTNGMNEGNKPIPGTSDARS